MENEIYEAKCKYDWGWNHPWNETLQKAELFS